MKRLRADLDRAVPPLDQVDTRAADDRVGALLVVADLVDVVVRRFDVVAAVDRAHVLDEAGLGRVDVQEARRGSIRERVDGARRREDVRPRAGDDGRAHRGELELALEHVERVDVPLVVVRSRALVPSVRDRELEYVELRLHRLDQDRPLLLTERLALAGPADDRLHDPEIMT